MTTRDQWQKLPGKEKLRRKADFVKKLEVGVKRSMHLQKFRDDHHRVPPPITLPRVPFQEKD